MHSPHNNVLIRSGEARLVGWSRSMLYSGFNTLLRSVVSLADFICRCDNTDVIWLSMNAENNPYQSPSDTRFGRTATRRMLKYAIAYLMLASIPSCIGLQSLKTSLLKSKVLNTKDLPPLVGNESGTVSEYLLNIWHWDAVTFLLGLVCIPCTIFGIVLLRRANTNSNSAR